MLSLASRAARGDRTHRPGVGLFVVLDELHAGAPDELAILLNAQNLTHDRQNNPLALLAAGIPSVGGILTAATFGERSRWLPLPELTDAELSDALTAPARDLDVTWDPDALTNVLAAAQHYPHFVQIIGSTTWNTVRPQPGTTITAQDARSGIRAGRAEIDALYAARWASVTDAERTLLSVIAQTPATPTGTIARRDIEQAFGGDISVYRARLIDKAILDDTERGQLRFTLPGFADYIRDQTTPAPSQPQLPHRPPASGPQPPAHTGAPHAESESHSALTERDMGRRERFGHRFQLRVHAPRTVVPFGLTAEKSMDVPGSWRTVRLTRAARSARLAVAVLSRAL